MASGIYTPCASEGPLRQGEILCDLIQLRLDVASMDAAEPLIHPFKHPYAIVASQDCDLDWDYKARYVGIENPQDKLIPNILFCEMFTAEELKGLGGERAQTIKGSNLWNPIRNNKNERYHFLQSADKTEDALNEGMPELGIDFKRYFTIPANEVYTRIASKEALRRCRLISPYLEHFSTRFAYYQFRVALPADHQSI